MSPKGVLRVYRPEIVHSTLLSQINEVTNHALLEVVSAVPSGYWDRYSITLIKGNTDSKVIIHNSDDVRDIYLVMRSNSRSSSGGDKLSINSR